MTCHLPVSPTGYRKFDQFTVAVNDLANSFSGLPADTDRNQVLATFKRAAPHLGISPALRDTIDMLFAYSNPRDWQEGRRPLVWPSNETLRADLCLSLRAVQYRLRELEVAGLVAIVSSPTGKRYGYRDSDGHIVEAYGIDLSPLAARLEEFAEAVALNRAERAERKALRRSITITRKAIIQIASAGMEAGFEGPAWSDVIDHANALGAPAARMEDLKGLADLLTDLEALHEQSDEVYRTALETAVSGDRSCGQTQAIASEGATDCTHIHLQQNLPSSKEDTGRSTPSSQQRDCSGGEACASDLKHRACGTLDEQAETHQLSPGLIAHVFPELGLDGLSDRPGWSDVIDAADYLGQGLGISRDAWRIACHTMGRDGAAISVALIAANAANIETPGGYLRGMIRKAQDGELHLGPSVYGVRDQRQMAA